MFLGRKIEVGEGLGNMVVMVSADGTSSCWRVGYLEDRGGRRRLPTLAFCLPRVLIRTYVRTS